MRVPRRGASTATFGFLTLAFVACSLPRSTHREASVHASATSLLNRLLDIEAADSNARSGVHAWLDAMTRAMTDTQGPHSMSGNEDTLTRFLGFLQTLSASDKRAEWALTRIARGQRGSCVALVGAAVLVGRSLGLRADPIAVPDHLLLRVENGGTTRLLELLDGGREVSWRDAAGRYRVPPPPATAFLRPLTEDEFLACILIERSAERLQAGRLRAADRDLRHAIRDYPDHPSGYYNLGLVEESRHRWKAADVLLSRAVTLNPLDARIWEHRGFVRWKKGRPAEALRDLDEAIRLDPESLGARTIRQQVLSAAP